MTKRIFLLLFFASTVGHSQNFYELGLGFRSLRIWNIDAPIDPMQNLEFYYAPELSFNYYFNNNVVIGAAAGIANEIGNIDSEFNSTIQTREDLRNSIHYQVTGGLNILKKKTSLLQLTAGIRANNTYFFQHFSRRTFQDGGGSTTQYEIDSWQGTRYQALLSVGYHKSLWSGLRDKNSVVIRVAWDIVYHFPHEYGTLRGVKNEYASFLTGLHASLIWRIRGKSNRGLF